MILSCFFHTRINCRISSNIEVAWKCERYTFILNIEIYVESQKVSQEIFLTMFLFAKADAYDRECAENESWSNHSDFNWPHTGPGFDFQGGNSWCSPILDLSGSWDSCLNMCCCFFQISILREPQGFCMILHHSTSFLCGFSPIYWPERYWGAIWRSMSGMPIKLAVQASHAVYRRIHLITLSFRCFHFNDLFCHWNSSDSKWDRQPCYHEGSPKISTSHDTTPGIAWNATVREQLWWQGSDICVFTLQWIKH